MKKILKLYLIILGLFISLTSKVHAEDALRDDIYDAIDRNIDSKLIYDINIRTIRPRYDIDIRKSNSKTSYMTSASTIKIFVGLAIRDAVAEGNLKYSEQIKEDLDLTLRNSDNDATNRLIKLLGFDKINQTIFKYTNSSNTKLNRLMLGNGPENITNSRDLTEGLIEIYKSKDEISKDMVSSMTNSSSKRVKLLKDIDKSFYTLNKTGELKNIENDLALVDTGKSIFIISLLTEDVEGLGRDKQLSIINKLGKDITDVFIKFDKINSKKSQINNRTHKSLIHLEDLENENLPENVMNIRSKFLMNFKS